ncbi:MAG: YARHG domain-containing protein [Clostridiales bacterium]|nr:YARHG domain-containing protein [Clostridiales bacterium]
MAQGLLGTWSGSFHLSDRIYGLQMVISRVGASYNVAAYYFSGAVNQGATIAHYTGYVHFFADDAFEIRYTHRHFAPQGWSATATMQATLNRGATYEEDIIAGDFTAGGTGTAILFRGDGVAFDGGGGVFILWDSHLRYLTDADVMWLSAAELRLARNEIFARRGRLFDSADLQNHFNAQSWYFGHIAPANFSYDMLNNFERANIALIQEWEAN